MKAFATLVLLGQLAFSLPTQPESSPALVPRKVHRESTHVSDFRSLKRDTPKLLGTRQTLINLTTSGNGNIVDNGLKYLLPITVGSQTIDVEIDTGSADTWIIQKGFKCFKTYNFTTGHYQGLEKEAACNFGTPATLAPSFTQIKPELVQHTCYGQSGEATNRCLDGIFYNATVDLLGVEIQGAYVSFPTNSSFPAQGKAEQSGLMGLGFPGATSGFSRNATTKKVQQTSYPSIMSVLFDNVTNTYDPPLPQMFSIALSRDKSGTGQAGKFTIGGVPSLNYPDVNVSSTEPSSAALIPYAGISNTSLSFYSFLIDGYAIGSNATAGGSTQVIVDSGAPTFEMPAALAKKVNNMWVPKGKLDDSGDLILDCTATLSEPVGVTIGGTTYYLQSQDLMLKSEGDCFSAVSAGDQEDGILIGDPFLKNVLAVFDWEDSQMSFYPRMYYKS